MSDRLDPDSDYAYDVTHGDQPEPDGVTCRACGTFVADDSTDDAYALHGAWYCDDCYYEQADVVEGLADALRDDERRDDQ